MMTTKDKEWIDSASYEQLLCKWRFAPIGDPMFTDIDTSDYYKEVMAKKRLETKDNGVSSSKSIGWTK
jgi:hypothetical protein